MAVPTPGELDEIYASSLILAYSVHENMTSASKPAEIWRFFDFSTWRPPPSWIFKISKTVEIV